MAPVSHLIALLRTGHPTYQAPRLHLLHSALGLIIYVLACRMIVRHLRGVWRERFFAGFNVAGVYGFLFYGRQNHSNGMFLIYLALIVFQYVMLRTFSQKKGWLPWLAFFD